MIFRLEMFDGGWSETKEIEADNVEAAADIAETETRDWILGGEWGEDGAAVDGYWALEQASEDGEYEEVDSGPVTVNIPPNHIYLAKAAGAPEDCEHDWTGEGHGGCDENPGVWSTGGTSIRITEHCRHCGVQRTRHLSGSQRNPGEPEERVEYSMPSSDVLDAWRRGGVLDE